MWVYIIYIYIWGEKWIVTTDRLKATNMCMEMERQSSIEKEPRTLNIHQIDYAREAALYVMNTRGVEEALRIFTEGLEPVVKCAESGPCHGQEQEEGEEDGGQQFNTKDKRIYRLPSLRDIASAPF